MAQTVTQLPGVDPAAPAATVPSAQPSRAKAPPAEPKEPNFGLVIEKVGDTGRYVYTVLDRATGRVISQIPSSEVLRLMKGDDYAAGAVFKTRL